MTDNVTKEGLLTENEYYNATGLNEDARNQCEKEGWIKPEIGPDGRKYYSPENVEPGKALKKYMDAGLPHSDAHELAVEAIARKKIRNTQGNITGQKTIDPTKIKTHPEFKGLFDIDSDLLKNITADMSANRYDESQPVVLIKWPRQDEFVLGDGHTRRQAAKDLGIEQIPYVTREFESQTAAFEYVMGLQAKRRITNDAVLFRLIETYDSLMKRGGDRRSEEAKSMPTGVGNEKGRSASAHRTAHMLNCHYKKVERARRILKDGTPRIIGAVRRGTKTINDAYNLIVKDANDKDGKAKEKERLKKISDAAKRLLHKKNLAGFKALGGNFVDHINKAAEQYIARRGWEDTGEEEESESDGQKPHNIQ